VQSGHAEIGSEDRANGSQIAATTCGPFRWKEVRPVDERSSWMQVLITVAVDWRFVIALVALALLLLLK
jgi:hypothetical protein